ncbi:MAG TPA: ABC transporter permease [Gammaproteobacteria bacterium]|nr:ABC transporter permease [Gammaproteobacteria bacterium]
MIRTFVTVMLKEIVDNLRDRRTLLTVLVFGPLFGPVFYTAMMNTVINKRVADLDQPLQLPVAGTQFAPDLIHYLRAHNTVIQAAPPDPRDAVRTGRKNVVLVIGKRYADAVRAGKPAPVELVMDRSRDAAAKDVDRARDLLQEYSRAIANLRLLARGVDPRVVTPVVIEDADVSTPRSRAALILGMVPYFFLFAAILGAFYLAIDTTAGERERGSLEPLLGTAAPRAMLVAGKISAVAVFSVVSLALDVLAMYWCQGLIPAAKLNIAAGFTPWSSILSFLVMIPFCAFIAALLCVVASFTKSYKEAQTWLSFIMIVPLVPVLATVFNPTEPRLWMMLVPSLSQDLLITALIKGEALSGAFVSVSVLSTLAGGAILMWLAVRLYGREKILG